MATSGAWWTERAGLEGTVAIVAGGAGGLGEAITLDLQANGVRVAVLDRDEAAVQQISAELDRRDADAIAEVGDARELERLSAFFATTAARWGRLDTVVNIAGGTFRAPFTTQSPRAWEALIRANLTPVLNGTSLAIPAMRAGGRGGSIVNLTTIEAHRAAPGFAVYSAAKAAIVNFTRTMALELAPERIRINNVAPDITPTPNMLALGGDDAESAPMMDPLNAKVAIPMGRIGVPTDISGAVVFLASGLSSYMTGTTLHPDGGTFASSGWFNWPGDGWGNMLPRDVLEHFHERSAG